MKTKCWGLKGNPVFDNSLLPACIVNLMEMFFSLPCRYGPIFRTSLAGRPVVISADPDFNNFLFQEEGRVSRAMVLG